VKQQLNPLTAVLTSVARHEFCARGCRHDKRYSSCTASLLCFPWHWI